MHPAVAVFVVCAVACAVAHVAIVISVVGRRAGTVDPAVPRPRLIVEVVWALLPALILAFVLTATWHKVRDQAGQRPVIMKIAR